MALVATVNGQNGQVYVEQEVDSEDFLEKREINGNDYGGVRNTFAGPSHRAPGEACGSRDHEPLYESGC